MLISLFWCIFMSICLTFLGLVIHLLCSEHAKSMYRIVLIAKNLAENNWRLQCTRIRVSESHKHNVKEVQRSRILITFAETFVFRKPWLISNVFVSKGRLLALSWIYSNNSLIPGLTEVCISLILALLICYHHIITLFLTRLSKWWWFSKANYSWTTIWSDWR